MGPKVRFRLSVCLCIVALGSSCAARQARASTVEESMVDLSMLATMEDRAAIAEPRERCYLYTELLHNWTEQAGRDFAAGDDDAAKTAMQHADADAAKLKAAIARDSKRLKNAELILEHSVHRLSDMMRVTTMEQRETMQTVLRHVSSVHDDLLAAVFAH